MLTIVKQMKAYNMNSATIAFRVKPEIKKRADRLFERLGMTTSTGMNVLLMQTLEHHGFPFQIVTSEVDEEEPNETTRTAIHDLDANNNLSRYGTVDEMMKDIL